MKTFKTIANSAKVALAATTVSLAMTSCLGDGDTSYANIIASGADCYANSNTAYLVIQSSSAWQLKKGSDAPWLMIEKSSGEGPAAGGVKLNTEQNITDKYRTAQMSLSNVEGKSSSTVIYQWGTRGDGSLGTARDVRKITGSDGSEITLSYDPHLHRVRILKVKDSKDVQTNYMFTYDSNTDTMTVRINDSLEAEAGINYGWQPVTDITSRDKSEIVTWSAVGTSVVTVKRNENSNSRNIQTVSVSGYESPDSELSNSKWYYSYAEDGKFPELNMTVKHDAKKSNRKQNIDVNQLILGVDKMNPYMLLGFYRYARCSYIYETAEDTTKGVKYTVSTTLNSDNSVSEMVVSRENGTSVTYTFAY